MLAAILAAFCWSRAVVLAAGGVVVLRIPLGGLGSGDRSSDEEDLRIPPPPPDLGVSGCW